MITYIRDITGVLQPTTAIPLDVEIAQHLNNFPFRACPCECHRRPNLLIDLSTGAVYELDACSMCGGTLLVHYQSFN